MATCYLRFWRRDDSFLLEEYAVRDDCLLEADAFDRLDVLALGGDGARVDLVMVLAVDVGRSTCRRLLPTFVDSRFRISTPRLPDCPPGAVDT